MDVKRIDQKKKQLVFSWTLGGRDSEMFNVLNFREWCCYYLSITCANACAPDCQLCLCYSLISYKNHYPRYAKLRKLVYILVKWGYFYIRIVVVQTPGHVIIHDLGSSSIWIATVVDYCFILFLWQRCALVVKAKGCQVNISIFLVWALTTFI